MLILAYCLFYLATIPFSSQYYRLEDYLPADVVHIYQTQFGMTRDLYDWQVSGA
jgi:hypothetical protein